MGRDRASDRRAPVHRPELSDRRPNSRPSACALQRLAATEQRLREATTDCENRVRELESALQTLDAEAREHAYRMQRFYAASLSDLLRDVQSNLENKPPNLEGALARIRELLDGERPAA
jgi:hypothetical protein